MLQGLFIGSSMLTIETVFNNYKKELTKFHSCWVDLKSQIGNDIIS